MTGRPGEALWSLPALVGRIAARGDRPAILAMRGESIRSWSGETLAGRVRGAARGLSEAGVAAGDVVALHAANGPEWIALGLACGWIGAVLAPLDAARPPGEAAAEAAAAGARLLVADAPDPAGETPARRLSEIAGAAADPPPAAAAAPDAPAALFRTSGTTGAPKPFHLTAGNLGYVAEAIAGCGLVREGDRVLLPLPLHHVYPWITAALGGLGAGAALILPEGPSGPEIAAALRRARPEVVVGVPKLYEAMLGAILARAGRLGPPLRGALDACAWLRRRTGLSPGAALFAPLRRRAAPSLRMLVCGGARLDRRTAERLEALGWDVRSGYGLSETASMIAANLRAKRLGTEGRPLPGSEARIDRPDARGIGEILLRGPGVFAGYLAMPDATARAFDAEGFFRSGDLGRLDADGFLEVVGRASEALTLGGGETLDPERIEAAYAAAPEIAEIAVFERDGRLLGLAAPDRETLARRSAADAAAGARIALAERARTLPSPQRLAGVAFTGRPLPRTRLGKLRRFRLPALYDAAARGEAPAADWTPSAEEAAWLAEPGRAAVWALLRRRHGARLRPDAHLQLDLGLDSFGLMELALAIETETGLAAPRERLARAQTARDLLEAVEPGGAPAAPAPASRDWLAPRAAGERAVGAALRRLAVAAMRLGYGVSATGAERLPRTGPLLICPNHASYLDAPALLAALPPALRPRTRWAASAELLFGDRLRAAVSRCLRAFPVYETRPDAAVALAAEALGRGEIVIWFPEGWRAPDGALGPLQAGVGRLIAETGTRVVPAAIHGAYEAWPRWRRLPGRGRVAVAFGAAIPAARLTGAAPSEAAAPPEVAAALRARMRRLLDVTRPGGDASAAQGARDDAA